MEEEDEETSSEEEDEEEQRARLRRTEQESDLKHAEDLIGDIDLNKKRSAAPRTVVLQDASDPSSKAIDLSSLPLFKPATKAQFATLTDTLIPVLTAQSKKPQYTLWASEFTKRLVKEMPSQEIKKVASAITAVSNEKLKEERAADKGGKKSKAAKTKTSLVTRSVNHVDTTSYADDDLGDDDFM
jgi:translation initiation factor 3 subunit J